MIRLYIIGISILIVAILSNFIAHKLNILTWYDFIEYLTKSGSREIVIRIIDVIWLFLVYPLMLGLGYWIGDKLYNSLF